MRCPSRTASLAQEVRKGSPRCSVSHPPVTPTSQWPSKPLAATSVGDPTCHSTPERQSRVERSDSENRSAAEARSVPLTASVVHSGASQEDRTDAGGVVLLAPCRSCLCSRPGPCSAAPQHRRRSPKTAVCAGATGEACRGLPPAPSDPPDLIPHRSVALAPERPHSPRGPSVAGTCSRYPTQSLTGRVSVPNSEHHRHSSGCVVGSVGSTATWPRQPVTSRERRITKSLCAGPQVHLGSGL